FSYATASTPLSPLSLHDALPIWTSSTGCHMIANGFIAAPAMGSSWTSSGPWPTSAHRRTKYGLRTRRPRSFEANGSMSFPSRNRSEEHTSELQSHLNLVCRLLVE